MALTESEELELLELENENALAQQSEAPERGFFDQVGDLIGSIKSDPSYAFSPGGLIESGYSKLKEGTEKAGKAVTEALQQPEVDIPLPSNPLIPARIPGLPPILAQAAGKVVEYSPDILTAMGPAQIAPKRLPVTNRAANVLDALAEVQAAKAAGAIGGDFKRLGEEKLRKAGRTAIEKGILSPFRTARRMGKKIREINAEAGEKIGAFLDDLETRGRAFNPKNAVSALEELRPRTAAGKILKGGEYAAKNAKIDHAIATIKAHGSKPIPFREANQLKGTLQDLANWRSNQNATALDKIIAGKFRETIDTGMESVSTTARNRPKFEEFIGNKRTYGDTELLGDLVESRVARETGKNAVGLPELMAASAFGGQQPSKAAYVAAGWKSARKFGNQNVALAANKLSNIVRDSPNKLGRFAPLLSQAAQRGANSLISTDFMLQQSDPEYRTLRAELDKEAERGQ